MAQDDVPQFPLVELPTPYPTEEVFDVDLDMEVIEPDAIVPKNEIYNYLASIVEDLNSLPQEIDDGAPDETGSQLISYAKWVLIGNAIAEMVGNTLAPLGTNVYVLLILTVVTFGFFITMEGVVRLFNTVQWIIRWIIDFVPFW